MPSTSIFPLEIEETIIDSLAEVDNNHSALKICSLVCQAFLPKCQKHIFASITLDERTSAAPSPTTQALERLLSENPKIADYIRKLDYNIQVTDFTSPSTQESLKRISRLESLTIRHFHRPRLDWSNNPIRPTLLHLLHLPTLTHFRLFAIDNFVVSDLVPCINLKHLDISHTTAATETTFPAALPEHQIRLNEFLAGIGSATTITKLCTVQRPDGQLVIDFGSLSKITVTIEKPIDSGPSQELFRRCEKLTDAYISFWDPREVRPSLADMLLPSIKTLKRVAVNIHVVDSNDDPLCGIPSELEDLRSKNIIEGINIRILVQTDGNTRRGDDWGKLDKVLTSSGWPALKQVTLAIEIAGYARSDNELEVALQNLPETQFPRLSASKSVSFDFRVKSVLV